jgi:hypothetical protein
MRLAEPPPFGSLAEISRQEVAAVPRKKEPVAGVGDKEQRMYEQIKESARKSGRYGKRAREVAARTVLKHHREEGHHKDQ